jgi:hypothetical protein
LQQQYQVTWHQIPENTWLVAIKKNSDIIFNTTELNILKESEYKLNFSIDFKKMKFYKFYLLLLPNLFSKIPKFFTSGMNSVTSDTLDSKRNINFIFAYYFLKNLSASRWIYIAANDGNNYFELAISSILGFSGVIWFLKTAIIEEKHNKMLSISKLRQKVRITDISSPFQQWRLKIGYRPTLNVLIKYEQQTLKPLWIDNSNKQHSIATTLEATIELSYSKSGFSAPIIWKRALFEINDILELLV